jgi:hypothetical protein
VLQQIAGKSHMLHIAGASLSCPQHSNNPKSQHSARDKKSSAAEHFSTDANRPYAQRPAAGTG